MYYLASSLRKWEENLHVSVELRLDRHTQSMEINLTSTCLCTSWHRAAWVCWWGKAGRCLCWAPVPPDRRPAWSPLHKTHTGSESHDTRLFTGNWTLRCTINNYKLWNVCGASVVTMMAAPEWLMIFWNQEPRRRAKVWWAITAAWRISTRRGCKEMCSELDCNTEVKALELI